MRSNGTLLHLCVDVAYSRHKIWTLLPVLWLWAACSFQTSAATYYVDQSQGSDANSGLSPGAAWQSLYFVGHSAALAPGDLVLLKCGEVWNESLQTVASDVTYGSYGSGPRPQITGFTPYGGLLAYDASRRAWTGSLSYAPPQVFINGTRGQRLDATAGTVLPGQWSWANNTLTIGASSGTSLPLVQISTILSMIAVRNQNITIQDIEVSGAGWYSVEGSLNDPWDYLVVQRCLLRDSFSDSLRLIGPSSHAGVVIQDNEVRNAGGSGILLNDNSSSDLIQRNVVWGNARLRNDVPGGLIDQTWTAGIKVYAEVPGYQSGTIVQFNNVFDNAEDPRLPREGSDQERGVGIWIDTVTIPAASPPLVVQFNSVYNNASQGIYLENTTNCGLQFNRTFNNAKYANTANLAMQSDLGGTTANSWARYNVIAGTGWAEVLFGGVGSSFLGNVFLYNKVILRGDGQLIYLEGAGAAAAEQNVIDYNLYSGSSSLLINAQSAELGNNYSTFASWQQSSNQDAHSSLTALP